MPRRWRFEITERVGAAGEIVTPLAEDEIDGDRGRDPRSRIWRSVAVALLFSFLNDAHERLLGEQLRAALPGIGIYLSCEILPEIREFERASTTAVCAYVGKLLAAYLDRLQTAASGLGLPPALCDGVERRDGRCRRGAAHAGDGGEAGPAAGVVPPQLAGAQLGLPNLISFDMGGTTAKASLIAGGEITVTAEYEVGGGGRAKRWLQGTGHPVRVPVIDLAEVSAGGGSIAWVDPGGSLRVGPDSAGAMPGPAAYGRGGLAPTVSDADIVLGWLDREALLGGDLPVDADAAERAIGREVAAPLGLSVAGGRREDRRGRQRQHGRGIAHRLGRTRPRSARFRADRVRRGGAGACDVSRRGTRDRGGHRAAGTGRVLGAGPRRQRRKTRVQPHALRRSRQVEPQRVVAALDAMAAEADIDAGGGAGAIGRRALRRAGSVRYRRQAYELTVPLADGKITRESWMRSPPSFHDRHRRTYGHANPNEKVQLVNLRLTASGRSPELILRSAWRRRPPDAQSATAWFRRDRAP